MYLNVFGFYDVEPFKVTFLHLKRNQKIMFHMFSSYFNFPPKKPVHPKIHTAGNFPAPSLNRRPTKPQESTLPGLPGHMELVLRPPWSHIEEISWLGWLVGDLQQSRIKKVPNWILVRGCHQVNSHWVVDLIQDALPDVFGGSKLVLVRFFVPHTFNKSAFCSGSKTNTTSHDMLIGYEALQKHLLIMELSWIIPTELRGYDPKNTQTI